MVLSGCEEWERTGLKGVGFELEGMLRMLDPLHQVCAKEIRPPGAIPNQYLTSMPHKVPHCLVSFSQAMQTDLHLSPQLAYAHASKQS